MRGGRTLFAFFLNLVIVFAWLFAFASCETEQNEKLDSEKSLQKLRDALSAAKKVTWKPETIEKESQKIFYEHLENLKNLRDYEDIGSDKWNYYNKKVTSRLITLMVDLEDEFGEVNRDNVQAFILKKYFGVTL